MSDETILDINEHESGMNAVDDDDDLRTYDTHIKTKPPPPGP